MTVGIRLRFQVVGLFQSPLPCEKIVTVSLVPGTTLRFVAPVQSLVSGVGVGVTVGVLFVTGVVGVGVVVLFAVVDVTVGVVVNP